MRTSSCKAKGRNLQNYVRDKLREIYVYENGLEPDDLTGRQMGGSGTDIVMTPIAKKRIPFDIECKNVEKLNVWDAIKQCETNTKQGREPLLIIKRNHTKVYAVVDLEYILKILKEKEDQWKISK